MKHLVFFLIFLLLICWFSGCGKVLQADIAATTLPVYEFTKILCEGTGLTVTRLVTESVSCLHDYTLKTTQLRAIQGSKALVISGAGLEDFLEDALTGAETVIDASQGLALLEGHHHDHDHGHVHENDPHLWLSPHCAGDMAKAICHGLCQAFPEHRDTLQANLPGLLHRLEALEAYGEERLQDLSCRELITFHDGFAYLAESFDLTVLEAVEEESGSETSAAQLIHLCQLVEQRQLPAIFTEVSGSVSAASVISRETGVPAYALDMAMSGESYFEAMYHNIDTLREALQ